MSKRLLIFTEYFLPAKRGGGPVTSIRNLVELLHSEYEIGIVCFNHDMNSKDELPGIISDDWNNWEEKARVFYAGKKSLKKNKIEGLIDEFSPEVIYINSIFVPQFLLYPIWKAEKIKSKVIVAPRGMLQDGAIENKPIKKKLYFSLLKAIGLFKNIYWHATDNQEEIDIKKLFHSGNILEVKNVPVSPTNKLPQTDERSTLRLLYLSLISEKKNLHFLLNILKENISRQIELDIYGPIKDKAYWAECLNIIETLPENVKVKYQGEVAPENISDIFPKYHLFILPTLGENFGHAIFEALANGIPVIISDKTPWKNLEERNVGFDLPLEDRRWIETLNSIKTEELISMRQDSLDFAKDYFERGNFKEKYRYLFNIDPVN